MISSLQMQNIRSKNGICKWAHCYFNGEITRGKEEEKVGGKFALKLYRIKWPAGTEKWAHTCIFVKLCSLMLFILKYCIMDKEFDCIRIKRQSWFGWMWSGLLRTLLSISPIKYIEKIESTTTVIWKRVYN